ncbi:MAG TPA: exodeoxyribonuclease VII large subunit [Spirochaetota bacterium]|nr:exodeoxyribonuclease VII large subunit [Spirochaetota bacterium]HOS32206.1 exodeoxyribonuclease VII large subunit [Spirochaetota bacterium]HOS55649.1 exodeoxyribonuclease VII large subunit [Spirochaetota bacterium]HPK60922.1 exodeoxyribonuclease VII large subunit [Spirochaetota bacterium]HQF78173.1 exodeoxyribonuclease VII large subunit [Spirochaetota bacterium]
MAVGPDRYLSISDFTRILKSNLESSFSTLFLRGEISNFKPSSSGHIYFVLKDKGASIKAIIFKGSLGAMSDSFKKGANLFKDGSEVLVEGRLSLYERNGDYSIIISRITPIGAGELAVKFELLKEKLSKEGLFDQSRKKTLPLYPVSVGIVTSPTGAALQDMLNVLNRRFSSLKITVFPTAVQGEEAKFEIVKAIECASYHYRKNTNLKVDILIISRGGGSIEDLWAFNEEIVAKAISNCPIPTITGIGHEIDFTIADFVSDLRAPTPSAAAEIAVKNGSDLLNTIVSYKIRIKGSFNLIMEKYLNRYSLCTLDKLLFYFKRIYENALQDFSFIKEKNNNKLKEILELNEKKFHLLMQKLDNLSPLKILQRGYSLVLDKDNKTISDSASVNTGDILRIILNKGKLEAEVTGVE